MRWRLNLASSAAIFRPQVEEWMATRGEADLVPTAPDPVAPVARENARAAALEEPR